MNPTQENLQGLKHALAREARESHSQRSVTAQKTTKTITDAPTASETEDGEVGDEEKPDEEQSAVAQSGKMAMGLRDNAVYINLNHETFQEIDMVTSTQ